jgi:alpha-amylase/alpha-mannosidase (GH57 family)
MALFFYDGPLSSALAFEGLARDGLALARRLVRTFDPGDRDQLVHVATDGETYGHHHAGGAQALAEALSLLDDDPSLRLTCYAEFLERHPPVHEVRIVERSSWSCPHELGRWQRHCGCAAGDAHEQSWRTPLREAVEDLRTRSAQPWERYAGRWFHDPWAARDDWIDVMLDTSAERFELFVERHGRPESTPAREAVHSMFEFQQRLIQAETSCAWFFEDLARIETIQVLRYAARAIELGGQIMELELERPFLDILQRAQSNDRDVGDGLALWNADVVPAGLKGS